MDLNKILEEILELSERLQLLGMAEGSAINEERAQKAIRMGSLFTILDSRIRQGGMPQRWADAQCARILAQVEVGDWGMNVR
jgi:hypothetical protein